MTEPLDRSVETAASHPVIVARRGTTVTPAVGRALLARRLTHIMLVRALLFTLLLGATVALYFGWGTPEELGGPYVTVLFVFIAVVHVLNILYAAGIRLFGDLRSMAAVQVGGDLLVSAVLIHFTGGANSAFILFLLLSPLEAAVTLGRRAALVTAGAGVLVLGAVTTMGYGELLPVLPGQTNLPWNIDFNAMVRSILLHGGAMFAMAVLAGYLAEQLRSADERVAEQEVHFADLAQHHADVIRCLSSGLLTVDPQGQLMTINQAAQRLLGVTEQAAAGRPLEAVAPELAAALDEGHTGQRFEVPLRRGDADRILGVSTSPLTDHLNQAAGLIIECQDFTALRQMEQTIKRSEHLAAIGRLAAGVAHEIRNPLGSISGALELLGGENDLPPDSHRLMGIALREIERLDGLIGELLDFARPRDPDLRPLDLGTEIGAMARDIRALVAEKGAPRVEVVETTPGLRIAGDRDQLEGVLWNLVRNAWQAGEEQRIALRVAAVGDQVELSVSDQGRGIPSEDLGKIFEPFFTTRTKGSGLGLATVQRAVQDHGATIEVKSQPGQGTTFTISFPALTPSPAS